MATYTWTGATNGTWSTATNWSPSGPPAAGDKVVVDVSTSASIAGFDASGTQLAQLDVYTSASSGYSIGSPASPLKVGADVVNLHLPDPAGGSSSGLGGIYLDLGASDSAVTVHGGPNQGSSGHEAVIIASTGTGSTLYVRGGSVGVGTMSDGQASTFATVTATGGTLNVGSNVTLTTLTNKGAQVTCASVVPTLNQYSSTTTLTGLATVSTALNAYGGIVVVNGRPASGATIATLNLRGGTVDLSKDLRALTISALSLGDGNLSTGTAGASQLTVSATSLYWGDLSGRGSTLSK